MKDFVFGIGTAQEGNNYFKLFYESGSINSYEPAGLRKKGPSYSAERSLRWACKRRAAV